MRDSGGNGLIVVSSLSHIISSWSSQLKLYPLSLTSLSSVSVSCAGIVILDGGRGGATCQ